MNIFDLYDNRTDFSQLKGKTLKKIEGCLPGENQIKFICDSGEEYFMYHSQDCCEQVDIYDVIGDVNDLIGNPILIAEERTSEENPVGFTKEYQDSFTWTFYELATIKGSVTIRWYGESNGYYSESVDFSKIK